MIVKLLGLLLIALGAGGAAHTFLRLCRNRVSSLRAAGRMLDLMQGELNTSALPLSQLLEAIMPCLNGPARSFSRLLREGMSKLGRCSFAEIWEENLRASFPDLSTVELQNLIELGGILGRYDLPRQTEALSQCRQFLRQCEKTASAELTEKRRLALGLAMTGTAMLGIILF